MKRILSVGFLLIVIINVLFLSGCSNEPGTLASWGVFHSGSDSHEIQLEQGDEVYFTYKAAALKGNIMMTLVNPAGVEVLKKELSEGGEINFQADIAGTFKVMVKKSGIACRYSIKWKIN